MGRTDLTLLFPHILGLPRIRKQTGATWREEIKSQPPPLHPLVVLDFKGCANCLAFQCTYRRVCFLGTKVQSVPAQCANSFHMASAPAPRNPFIYSFIHSSTQVSFSSETLVPREGVGQKEGWPLPSVFGHVSCSRLCGLGQGHTCS